MTKILSVTNLDFGTVTINQNSTKTATVYNIGTERVILDGVNSNNAIFTPQTITQSNLMPQFPQNSTIHFDSLGRIQNAAGQFYTTDQGYGYCGTTDGSRILTIDIGGMNKITGTIYSSLSVDDIIIPVNPTFLLTSTNIEETTI